MGSEEEGRSTMQRRNSFVNIKEPKSQCRLPNTQCSWADIHILQASVASGLSCSVENPMFSFPPFILKDVIFTEMKNEGQIDS